MIQPRLGMFAVPAEAEAIAVSAGGGLKRFDALRDQRMLRFGDIMLKGSSAAPISNPSAHFGSNVQAAREMMSGLVAPPASLRSSQCWPHAAIRLFGDRSAGQLRAFDPILCSEDLHR